MKYLKIWTNFAEAITPLADDEVGRLFRFMLRYAETGEEPSEFSGNELFLWWVAKRDIDNMAEESRRNSENGAKGGRPPKQDKPEETDINRHKPEETEEYREEPEESQKEKKRKERKEKETEKKDEREPQRRFNPPTVEEVAEYCRERNNGINAQHFVDYYTQGNWVLKNGRKMADWRAAVRTWEGNGYHNKPAGKTVSAQNYSQRDYSGEQEDAMRRMVGRTGRPAEQTAYNFTQRAYDDADDKIIQRMLAMGDETKGVTA